MLEWALGALHKPPGPPHNCFSHHSYVWFAAPWSDHVVTGFTEVEPEALGAMCIDNSSLPSVRKTRDNSPQLLRISFRSSNVRGLNFHPQNFVIRKSTIYTPHRTPEFRRALFNVRHILRLAAAASSTASAIIPCVLTRVIDSFMAHSRCKRSRKMSRSR